MGQRRAARIGRRRSRRAQIYKVSHLAPGLLLAGVGMLARRLLRSRVRWLLVAACAVLYSAHPSPAAATIFVITDAQTIAASADVVVVGTVESTATRWRGKRIVTRAVVKVTDLAKGATAERIQVVVPGGTLDGVTMRVIGGPQLRKGDRSVLFLRAAVSGYRVVGLTQGKLDVFLDESSRPSVTWIAPGESKPSTVPLNVAVDRLRTAARSDER